MKPSLITLSPLALALLAASSGAYAICTLGAQYTVTNTQDSGAGSLRQAIADAAANPNCDGDPDQISFSAGVLGQTITLESTLSITDDDVSITGSAGSYVAIKRSGNFNVLDISGNSGNRDVTLEYLDFDGESTSQSSSMINLNSTGTVQLNQIKVHDVISTSTSPIYLNESSGSVSIDGGEYSNNQGSTGGVFTITSGSLNITNSTFQGNSATGDGGVLNIPTGTVSVSGTTFDNNTTPNLGGVAYLHGGDLTINESSTISNNSAGSGGAFYVVNSSSTLDISNSVISGNTATGEYGSGGAVFATAGQFSSNDNEFDNNSSRANGGAIYSTFSSSGGEDISVSDTEFTNNSSDSGMGGAIFISLSNAESSPSLTFDGNDFENNTSYYAGGAFAIQNSNSTATINILDSQFTSNTADNTNEGHVGGAIGTECDGCTLDLNVETSDFTGNTGGKGGAIGMEGYNTATYSFTAYQDSFINNVATNSGGALYFTEWTASAGEYNFQNDNSTFSGNSAQNGGAIYFADREKLASVSMRYLTIMENSASVEGGGIMSAGGTATTPLYMLASVLGSNTAPTNPDFSVGGHQINFDNSVVGNANGYSNEGNYWTNYAGTTGPGAVSDIGNNGTISALDVSSMFEPLADNGGPGLTYYPIDNMYVIDVVDNDESEDERGVARDYQANDRGAVEAGSKPVTFKIPSGDLKLKLNQDFSIDLNNYITDSGLDTPPGSYTFTVDSLPEGLSLTSGVITGTVNQETLDSLPFTVDLTIGNGVVDRNIEIEFKKKGSGGGGSMDWWFAPLLLVAGRIRKRK